MAARDETNLTVSLRSLFQGNFAPFLEPVHLSPGSLPYDHSLYNRFLTNCCFHVVAHQKLYKTPYHDLIDISNCWRVTGFELYKPSKIQVPRLSVKTYLSIENERSACSIASSVRSTATISIFIQIVLLDHELQPKVYFGYTSDVTFVAPESFRGKISKNGSVYLGSGSLYACSQNFSQKY